MALTVGFAPALVNAWLDCFGTAQGVIGPALFAKIHVGIPGVAGVTSPSVGDATTKAVTWGAAAGGVKAISNTPVWTNGSATESISHVTLWKETGATTFQLSGALSTPQAWVSTNTFTLTSFSVSLSPVASN